jgi:hypothetical protein
MEMLRFVVDGIHGLHGMSGTKASVTYVSFSTALRVNSPASTILFSTTYRDFSKIVTAA